MDSEVEEGAAGEDGSGDEVPLAGGLLVDVALEEDLLVELGVGDEEFGVLV